MNKIKKRVKRIVNSIPRNIARIIARAGIIWPFVFFYSKFVIKEVKPQKVKANRSKITLLALNAYRFRKDLETLVETGEFRIFKIYAKWRSRLLVLFLTKAIEFEAHFNPAGDESLIKMQEELKVFLRKFLSSLYRKLKIDGVIGAGIAYTGDYYWGIVSEELGVPYIVLLRENLVTTPKIIERNYRRAKRMGKFRGSYLIVQNNTLKDVFTRAGFVSPDRISALGCIRMDKFVRKIKELGTPHPHNNKRKKVALFSFKHGVGLAEFMGAWSKDGKTGFVRLFDDVHSAFARLAIGNPDVDFIIKSIWGWDWPDRIAEACKKNGIEIKGLANLSIVPDANAQELILESDVVCGFASTTLLEAGIASKPVVVPYFDEAVEPKYSGYVHLKDELHLFDVARSVTGFEGLILKRLKDPVIDEKCLSERFRVFEKYISSMNADALDKYVKTIKQVICSRLPRGKWN